MASCTKNESNLQNSEESLVNKAKASDSKVFQKCNDIPADLKVPEGNELASKLYAKGVQIYEVRRNAANPNVFEWVNTAPSATLYATPHFTNVFGVHYKGPTWQFIKGFNKNEKVIGVKQKAVTVDATAIPWLLLKAVDSPSTGNKVTYIQRICTAGGLAPTKPATEANLGEVDSIPYTAVYVFYTKN